MTFVDVHLIEETTEYRFVLLKNYMGNKPFEIFLGSTPKKFRRVCMEFSKHNWATISATICPEMLIFGK